MNSLHVRQRTDSFFDKHPLALWSYFLVGALLSSSWVILERVSHGLPLWANLLTGGIVFGWLIWMGPQYVRHNNRRKVLLLGVLALFAPHFVHAFMLWLGQPGWPLDEFMGQQYVDAGGLLSLFIIVGVLYWLLLLRMKMYEPNKKKSTK